MEFARAYEEQRLGISLERGRPAALRRAPPATAISKIFAVSVAIQRETGGNLAEILDNIADDHPRSGTKFYGKLRALTAEARGRASSSASLPDPSSRSLVSVLNPGYLAPLTGTPLGRGILMYAVISWLVGLAWLKKMSNLRY